MKRNLILSFKLLVSFIGLAFWSTLLAILMFPYQVFRVLMPKRKPGRPGGHPWSRFFKTKFENKQAKKFIGASLATLLMFSGVINGIVLGSEVQPSVDETVRMKPVVEVETTTSLKQPLNGVLGQNYHGFHKAIDVLAPIGTEIRPIAGGKVIEVSFGRLGWGHTVVVDHGNELKSRYAHLKEIKVIEGEEIDENFVLGTVGMTGWTTGPHLHLEVYQNGRAINPMSVLPELEVIRLASNQ